MGPLLEVLDSEDDGEGGLDSPPAPAPQDPIAIPQPPPPPPPTTTTTTEPDASGELRQRAISEAHQALIASSSPSKKSSPIKMAEKEKDIYDFDFEDPPSPPPKTTTAAKRRRTAIDEDGLAKKGKKDDDSDFEEPATKKKTKKTPARSKTMPEVFDLSSGDDYDPKPNPRAKAAPAKGKKATRSNTDQQELLPPMPKPKRQKRDLTKELQDFLPLPAEKKAASPQKDFMVDMTHDNFVVPTEKRHEYESAHVLDSDGASVLASTIPDPPEFLETVDPRTGLSKNWEQFSPPADSSGFAPPPLGSSDASPAPSKPPSSPPLQPKAKKQRAKTDTTLIGEFDSDASGGGIRIASEWRAAKAKGMQNLSDKQGQGSFVEGEIHSDGGGRKTTVKKKTPQPKKKKEQAAPKKKGKQAKNNEVIIPEETFNNTIAVAEPTEPRNDMVDELLGPTPVPSPVKPNIDSQKTIQSVDITPLSLTAGHIEQPQLGPTAEPVSSFLDNIGRMSRAAADIETKSVEKPEAPKPTPAKRKRTKTAVEESADDYVEPEHSADEVVEVTAGKKKKPAAKTAAAKRKRTKTAEEKYPVEDAEPPAKKVAVGKKGGKAKTNEAAVELEPEEDPVAISEPPAKKPAAALRKKVGRAKTKEAVMEPEPEKGPNEESKEAPEDESKERPKNELKEEESKKELQEGSKAPSPLPPPHSKSPEKAKESSKRGGTPHSPLRGGKIPYRVGLSKRARIEPLLSVRPREKKRPE
jgi:hypothetical protein